MEIVIIVLLVVAGIMLNYSSFEAGKYTGHIKGYEVQQDIIEGLKKVYSRKEQQYNQEIERLEQELSEVSKELEDHKKQQEDLKDYLTSDGKYFKAALNRIEE